MFLWVNERGLDLILNREIVDKIGLAFDETIGEVNKELEEGEHITGIRTHEYYELSIPRGEDPTSKYLVEYEKIEHFLNTEHPDINLSSITLGEMKEVMREMLDVYREAHD